MIEGWKELNCHIFFREISTSGRSSFTAIYWSSKEGSGCDEKRCGTSDAMVSVMLFKWLVIVEVETLPSRLGASLAVACRAYLSVSVGTLTSVIFLRWKSLYCPVLLLFISYFLQFYFFILFQWWWSVDADEMRVSSNVSWREPYAQESGVAQRSENVLLK